MIDFHDFYDSSPFSMTKLYLQSGAILSRGKKRLDSHVVKAKLTLRLQVGCASRNHIPIICIVDCDKQPVRSVVDAYMESCDSFLFDEQVISVTSQSREHSYSLIIEAIKRAVQAAFTRMTPKPPPVPAEETVEESAQPKLDPVHEPDGDPQIDLMTALYSKFGTAKAAFDTFSNGEGTIGKKEWKRVVKKTLLAISHTDANALRKKLPKKVDLAQFCELMSEVKSKDEQSNDSDSTSHPSSHLAELPSEVPVLPTAFKSRPHAHEQLVAALLNSGGTSSTAVTAPKSRVSSQGMGGVGKTMLAAAAVVRDERVCGAFEKMAWIGMSQQPDLLQLQAKLYHQLHPDNDKMPSKADTVESQLTELRCTQLMDIVHTNCILTGKSARNVWFS
jgi:hypothetical protein